MKTIYKSLYLASLMGVGAVATLYTIALLTHPLVSLNITHMMRLEDGSHVTAFYGWLYALSLYGTMIAGGACFIRSSLSRTTIVLTGVSLALTIAPLVYSLIFNYQPSIYERYVGEVLTSIGLGIVGWFCLRQRPNKPELKQKGYLWNYYGFTKLHIWGAHIVVSLFGALGSVALTVCILKFTSLPDQIFNKIVLISIGSFAGATAVAACSILSLIFFSKINPNHTDSPANE